MTPLQVFIAYAKIRNIIPSICKIAFDNNRLYFDFDPKTGQYTGKRMPFKEMFDSHFKNWGFGNTLFVSLLYQYKDGDVMLKKPDVEKAHRRWTTFVNNNVIYDGNIKLGSKIKYISWGSERTGVVTFINKDFSKVKVKRYGSNTIDSVYPGCVTEVDDQPVDISFHIRWKGKEYGNK
jgi:hypothetical protein